MPDLGRWNLDERGVPAFGGFPNAAVRNAEGGTMPDVLNRRAPAPDLGLTTLVSLPERSEIKR